VPVVDGHTTIQSIEKAQSEMDLMLRALLEQRFQLKLHRETKDLPVYELTLAKAGKLRHGSCTTFDPSNPLPPSVTGQQRLQIGKKRIGLDTGRCGDENDRFGGHPFLPDREPHRHQQNRVRGNV
jgi:Protein of unknown function (DUF3738)